MICRENVVEICQFQGYVEIRKDIYINTEEYINMMSNDGNWATNIDITTTAYLYNINIEIYLNSDVKGDKNLYYAHLFSYEETKFTEPLLILLNENFNHFNIIYDIDEYENIKEINKSLDNISKESIVNIWSDSEISIKSNDSGENEKINNKYENKKEIVETKENEITLGKYKYDLNNPFPKYILGEDENLYFNINNYLKKWIN